jgi:hypothetical protein
LSRSRTGSQPRRRANSRIDLLTLKAHKTKYALEKYKVFYSAELARQYEPIVYASECMSGDPEALYYRILQNHKKNEFCIQYFYYWEYQNCMMASHGYDYEPIFIYLKSNSSIPYLIVNGGLGNPNCRFHKNEVRPRKGKKDNDTRHVTTTLSPYPSYPFGQEGNVKYHVCVNTYPLDTGKDLQFEDQYHPLFGIRACSNVFSGAEGDLHGDRFNPPLKKLTDRVLSNWYFHHYENTDDMPFGHDIADPFTSPYIKFHKPSKQEVERLKKLRR